MVARAEKAVAIITADREVADGPAITVQHLEQAEAETPAVAVTAAEVAVEVTEGEVGEVMEEAGAAARVAIAAQAAVEAADENNTARSSGQPSGFTACVLSRTRSLTKARPKGE